MNINKIFGNVPIGFLIQKTIKGNGVTTTSKIFRIRRGNGYYGSETGKLYQDQYDYFIPTSITNAEGQHSREILTAAVAEWQSISEPEKKEWRIKAWKHAPLSGYNLFVREYMIENI